MLHYSDVMTEGVGLYCDVLVAVLVSGYSRLSRRRFFEGASPTKHIWCEKTRVIALSCGIKISAVHCLVLSQSARVTDRQTDGQNYDSQDRASMVALRGENLDHTNTRNKTADKHRSIL